VAVIDIAGVLDRYRDRSSNYGAVALFDHLPMTVAALAEMGASEARIEAWARRYAEVHELRQVGEAERTGRERWLRLIRERGSAAVISEHGSFHAAIRAAYAFERSDNEEMAAALEAWEREHLALPGVAREQRVSLDVALAELAGEPISAPRGGLIVSRMQIVAQDPRFLSIGEFVPSKGDLGGLALAAAAAFGLSLDFTALHVMTATFAATILAPYLDESTMPGFWRAYVAAAIVAGTVPTLDPAALETLRAGAPPRWEPLLAAAVAQDDEHVIKATYTAWRLDRAEPDGVYRAAASRYLARRH
jgi:hypothetical protein